MGLILDFDEGQTPLDEEEKEGLKIRSISTRGELDEFEQQNIEQAVLWTLTKSINPQKLLEEKFILDLHKRMYSQVWLWAGKFRKTEKNIGVPFWEISSQLKYLLDDARYWLINNTYSPDEFAIRVKHRLVSIHCFSNGNGRHSRLFADLLIEKLYNQPVFTWGAKKLSGPVGPRKAYLEAIKKADLGDYLDLISFSRS